jgi:isopenicillin-N epimerase
MDAGLSTRRELLRRGVGAALCGSFASRAAQAALLGGALRDDALPRVQAAQRAAAGSLPDELARREDFWFQVQQAFAVDRSVINLNNGGVSPSPRVVQDALRRHAAFTNQSPARNLWQVLDPQVETVRGRLAATFGCSPDELAITRNASEALETCILGMDLKPGDEALATELDYPRMLTTYRQREQRDGIRLVLAPIEVPVQDPADVVEAYHRRITPRTRVMLVSHVVFVTGQVFPVREICRLGRERDIPVIVDGAHAFAHVCFQRDDLECEYYGTSLHKWLTAALGTGFLYVHRSRIESLWPLMAAEPSAAAGIRKFEEIGTHPSAERLAIAEALNFFDAIGPQRKEARLRFLRDRWARRLAQDARVRLMTRLEPRHGAALATFQVQGVDSAKLVDHLWNKHRVIVTAIDYANVQGVRVSPNVYTTLEEIDQFCAAVEEVLANGLPG